MLGLLVYLAISIVFFIGVGLFAAKSFDFRTGGGGGLKFLIFLGACCWPGSLLIGFFVIVIFAVSYVFDWFSSLFHGTE